MENKKMQFQKTDNQEIEVLTPLTSALNVPESLPVLSGTLDF
jgi:hypothetical protein